MSKYEPKPYDRHVTVVAAEGRFPLTPEDARLDWAKLANGHTVYRTDGTSAGRLLRDPLVQTVADYVSQSLSPVEDSSQATVA
jgi:hypothetical protein